MALFAVCVLALRHRPDLRVPLTRPALSRYLQGVVTSGPRWTTATTQVFLHGADGISGTLLLRFKPHPSLGRDVTVGISQEGRLVGEIRPRRKMRTYRVPVESAPTLGPWLEPVPLEVRCDQYAKFWNGEEVCVRLEGIAFEPTPGGITSTKATMWRGACLAWSFLLLAWCVRVATRRLGRFARQALLATLASVRLVLAAWAHLRPYELAWWLPPMLVALAGLSFAALLWSGGSLPRVPRLALPAGYAFLGASLALAGWSPEAAAAMIFVGLLWLALFERAADDCAPEPTKRGVTLVPLLIVTVAAAVRLYRLDDLPFGMWRDEARHGLFALRMIEEPSYRPTYVADSESNVNLPAFGLYLLAVGVKLFGIDDWTIASPSPRWRESRGTTVVVYFRARHLLGSARGMRPGGVQSRHGVFLAHLAQPEPVPDDLPILLFHLGGAAPAARGARQGSARRALRRAACGRLRPGPGRPDLPLGPGQSRRRNSSPGLPGRDQRRHRAQDGRTTRRGSRGFRPSPGAWLRSPEP